MRRVMPFGKHKGEPFEYIPLDYLDWLLKQDWLSARLRKEIEEFLAEEAAGPDDCFRHDHPPPNGAANGKLSLTPKEKTDVAQMVELGFRALAKKYHPDAGGKKEDMQRLNALIAKLRESGLV